jgi:hypothetical protein
MISNILAYECHDFVVAVPLQFDSLQTYYSSLKLPSLVSFYATSLLK